MSAKVRPIRYFSPSGEGMPNGCYIQRGGFLSDCSKNARSFATTGIAGGGKPPVGFRGGILVFPVSARPELDPVGVGWQECFPDVGAASCRTAETCKRSNALVAGHAFKGTYRDLETGAEFGAGSMTIEVGRLSSRELRQLAIRMANHFRPRTVLVKDLNDDSFYLVDSR